MNALSGSSQRDGPYQSETKSLADLHFYRPSSLLPIEMPGANAGAARVRRRGSAAGVQDLIAARRQGEHLHL